MDFWNTRRNSRIDAEFHDVADELGIPRMRWRSSVRPRLPRRSLRSARKRVIERLLRVHAAEIVCDWALGFCFEEQDGFHIPPDAIVYFVEGASLVKIGTTNNFTTRLKDLRATSPVPIEPIATIDGGREVERALHLRFAAARAHGEWFRRESDLTDFLARLVKEQAREGAA